jgi:hypothetical protein
MFTIIVVMVVRVTAKFRSNNPGYIPMGINQAGLSRVILNPTPARMSNQKLSLSIGLIFLLGLSHFEIVAFNY